MGSARNRKRCRYIVFPMPHVRFKFLQRTHN